MYTVTYYYYNKYTHEKQFDNIISARKFFWFIQKQRGVTKTMLDMV
jgi:hypothetical protein